MGQQTHLSAIQSESTTMNYSNTIITDDNLQITLSKKYIETLYLSTNLYEHIEGNDTAYNKHQIALNKFYNSIPSLDCYLGLSGGREWYQMTNYRIGILVDFDLAIKANWYTCIIQYSQSHMFSLPSTLKGLDLPFSDDITKYHINRADVTHIYKSPVDYLNGYGIISRYRKVTTIEDNRKIETKYLGSRNSGNMVRWYNKTKELKSKEDYKKINLLHNYFNGIDDLYTIELELRRDYLKRNNIDTLQDLKKVYALYSDNIGSMRIYKDTEVNKRHIELKNYERIATLKVAEYIKYNRPKAKKKAPSEKYFIERFAKSFKRFSTACDSMSFSDRIKLLDSLCSVVFGRQLKEVDFYIEDCEELEQVKEICQVADFVRANQTNDLEIESKRAFC